MHGRYGAAVVLCIARAVRTAVAGTCGTRGLGREVIAADVLGAEIVAGRVGATITTRAVLAHGARSASLGGSASHVCARRANCAEHQHPQVRMRHPLQLSI